VSIGIDELGTLIRRRRTNLFVDPDRPVSDELVEELCELASWAPCHKRTWPWRFAAVSGAARERLGAVAAAAIEAAGADQQKVDKTRHKYRRAPTVIIVGAVDGDSELRTVENRHAVAAAVQNMLLAATAAGLASYWSSCPSGAERAVAEVAGFDVTTAVVGLVYVGWPVRECPAPMRPPVDLTHIR
jgi:nitroreductase